MPARWALALLFLGGHFLEDHLSDFSADVLGIQAKHAGLDDIGLIGESFDDAADRRNLGHSQVIAKILQTLFGMGKQLDPHDHTTGRLITIGHC